MTWDELLALWKRQTADRIEREVARFDERLVAEGASAEERARLAAELREALIAGTDLGVADLVVDWAEKSARLRAEGLARTEEICRRDGLNVLEVEFVVAQAEVALDEKIEAGFEMLRAARARAPVPPTIQ